MKKHFISDQVKRMMIGFGFMFGLQMIVAWVAKGWFGISGDNNNIIGVPLILTTAIYFGGGLVMSLLTEEINWIEPFLVTMLAIIVTVYLHIIGAASDLTFISVAISSKSPTVPILVNCFSVMLAVFAGVFLGARMKLPINDTVGRSLSLVGFVSLIIGPYLLLSASTVGQYRSGLPWYIMVIITLALSVITGVGYMLSLNEHGKIDEMSINPNSR